LQSMFTTNVPFKTKCFLGIISLAHTYVKDAYYNFTQVLNIIWEMWSISMDNVNIRCVRSCRENIFPGQIYEVVGGGSLRFQCRGWISLYGLSFNLAALVRLCYHIVRYFHPSARFLNGETASRTFHILDFCRR